MKNPSRSDIASKTQGLASTTATPETRLMPPYLRYSVPAERAQIDARIQAARKKWAMANPSPDQGNVIGGVLVTTEPSGPKLADQGTVIDGLLVGTETPNPPKGGGVLSSPVKTAVRGRLPTTAMENPPAAQPAERRSITPTVTPGQKKVAAPASIIPDGVVALGWYCSTEFRVNCATGQTGTGYIFSLWCGSEKFDLTQNNNGTCWFYLDGQTYNLGAKASNGTLDVKVVCEVIPRAEAEYQVELPITLNFINQTPCISLHNALLPEEQDPAEMVGDDHGQRPKVRVNLTAPAGPSGQTVFMILNDPHNPAVGRLASAGIDSFVIPFGQTSGEWEGFLGTRSVLSEKTISLRARVNGQESQPMTIKVQRKKK